MAGQSLAAMLALRHAIASGALMPRARLTEASLAARLGVSRTPLRAAMAQLAAEGLLTKIGAGYSVRGFTEAEIADEIALRGTLEGMAARLAAERGLVAAAASRLRARLDRIDALLAAGSRDAASFGAYVAENAAFHAGIVAAAESSAPAEAVARVNAAPFASASAFVQVQAESADSWAVLAMAQTQHAAVLEAITGREGSRAEALLREHARIALANLRRAVAAIGSGQAGGAVAGLRLVLADAEAA